MSESRARRPTVLYTLGVGHCGSTLLNISLGQHSEILGVGEVVHLDGRDDVPNEPLWRDALELLERSSGRPLGSLPFKPGKRRFHGLFTRRVRDPDWLRLNEEFVGIMSEVSGKKVFADSSKEWQRLHQISRSKDLDVKVIYLVRDARGVVFSYKRKYGSLFEGMGRLFKVDLSARLFRRLHASDDNWMELKYECFVADPVGTARRVCAFLDLEYEPAMARPASEGYAGVGGNRLRDKAIRGLSVDDSWKSGLARRESFLVGLLFVAYSWRHRYPLLGSRVTGR